MLALPAQKPLCVLHRLPTTVTAILKALRMAGVA